VTVRVLADWIASLVVAVIFISTPALYEPLSLVDEKLLIVGAVMSRVIVTADVTAAFGPVVPSDFLAPPLANTGMTVPSLALHALIVNV